MRSTSWRDDLLGVVRLFHALPQVRVHHILKIVDIVQEDVIHFVHAGAMLRGTAISIRNIGLLRRRADHALHLVLVQDVVRRAARGDQDIHFRQHGSGMRDTPPACPETASPFRRARS